MLISSAPVSSSKRIASVRYVLFTTSIMSAFIASSLSRENRGQGDLAVSGLDDYVCIVTGPRVRNDAAVYILKHGIPKTLLRQILGEPLHQLGIGGNLIRGSIVNVDSGPSSA